jgi:hypothetical protein
MTFDPKSEQRIADAVLIVEQGIGRVSRRPKTRIKRDTQRLVKLTNQLTNAKVWEAIEVYLDEDGEAVEIIDGLEFIGDIIVFTVADSSVDDVMLVQPKHRPDGTVFWVGGGSGGGSSTVIANNKTQIDGNEFNGSAEITDSDNAALIGTTVSWKVTLAGAKGWIDIDESFILTKVGNFYYADASFALLRGTPPFGTLT